MIEHNHVGSDRPPTTVVEAAIELLSAAGGTARLHVAGLSMAPLLCPGDVVIVQLGKLQPRLGDVVVRRQDGALVVHRVVKVTGEHIITKGDASLLADPPTTLDDILGVVTAIEGASAVDLTHGVWRALGPALAAYSLLVGRAWWALSVLRRRLLPDWSPRALRIVGHALRFTLGVPMRLLVRAVRRA